MAEQRKFIIYKVTNLIDGKSYIGQTAISLAKRRVGHIQKVNCGSKSYFHNAIRIYGVDTFIWEMICLCSSKPEADAKECEFISVLDTKVPFGYNLTDGGEGTVGFSPSKETLLKRSKAMKGRKLSEDHKTKIIKALTGYKHSDETRANMSQAHIGSKQTDEAKAKVSKSLIGNKRMVGYKMPDATKIKIGAASKGNQYNLGRKTSDKTKEKLSLALKGRKKSDETRAKMSDAQKGHEVSYEARVKRANTWAVWRQTLSTDKLPRKSNKSGITGVYWSKRNSKWKAEITINRKNKSLGLFDNKQDAGKAYLKAKQESVLFYKDVV